MELLVVGIIFVFVFMIVLMNAGKKARKEEGTVPQGMEVLLRMVRTVDMTVAVIVEAEMAEAAGATDPVAFRSPHVTIIG